MGQRGVRVDMEMLEKLKEEIGTKVATLQAQFDSFAPGVNPRSPKQMIKLLYEDLKLPAKINRMTKKVTTNEDAIKSLGKKYGKKFPVLQTLLDLREVAKMQGTYAEVALGKDGRLRTMYLITGTGTGRFSSKMAEDDEGEKEGLNMQNLPPWFREVIIPDEGKVFLEGDLSGAEARIVAFLSGEEEMIRVFEEGRNIHKLNASKLFGIPEEQVAKDSSSDQPYGKAKRITHGFDYKLGAEHAAEIAGSSLAEMERLRAAYFRAFPNLFLWHKAIEQVSLTNRTLLTPYGRRRIFLGRPPKRKGKDGKIIPNEDLLRKMIAFVPQSTCTEYLKRGMLAAEPELPEGAEFLMDNHDGFLLQCFQKDLEAIEKLMRHKTCIPLLIRDILGKERMLTIPMETKSGYRWGEDMK